ncbi:putative motility protein [Acutalibacter sp. 1XD8-33]|uniref:putative motility protein n=1 Tax=Acutalibacter sp. 1XD8-33 TaxID=2320081 RepID=UPI000EA2EE8E|nr:putative motility protein [Acutalibacter sp. 1XD8-33]RKJ41346.1 putative motility protein [Acutalibacter sp. 1XD8-33]
MEITNAVGATDMDYSKAQLSTEYSLALTKRAMKDTQELASQELQRMLPPSPYTFDVRV